MSNAQSPYLSIVVSSRNDDHGGNPLQRMQVCMDCLAEQCARFELPAELIIVEWNPPKEKKTFVNILRFPKGNKYFEVRIIEVSPDIHETLNFACVLPFFQMIAKNVGIRRARGQFVLATNIDILFSDTLIEFLSRQTLSPGNMYRIDRHDVASEVLKVASTKGIQEFCPAHVIRIHKKGRTLILNSRNPLPFIQDRVKTLFLKLLRNSPPKIAPIHTNACGDFTLMSLKDWNDLRGYPELELYSFKLDGLFSYTAYFSGIPEVILKEPLRIYHIEHSIGSGWTPGVGAQVLEKRLEKSQIGRLSSEHYRKYLSLIKQGKKPFLWNSASWGFAESTLRETLR